MCLDDEDDARSIVADAAEIRGMGMVTEGIGWEASSVGRRKHNEESSSGLPQSRATELGETAKEAETGLRRGGVLHAMHATMGRKEEGEEEKGGGGQ